MLGIIPSILFLLVVTCFVYARQVTVNVKLAGPRCVSDSSTTTITSDRGMRKRTGRTQGLVLVIDTRVRVVGNMAMQMGCRASGGETSVPLVKQGQRGVLKSSGKGC